MFRFFLAIFGGAFLVIVVGVSFVPNLVLGHFQDDMVKAWNDAGVDTSSCKGSVPKLGIGVRECYEGSIRSLAEQIGEAEREAHRYDPADY